MGWRNTLLARLLSFRVPSVSLSTLHYSKLGEEREKEGLRTTQAGRLNCGLKLIFSVVHTIQCFRMAPVVKLRSKVAISALIFTFAVFGTSLSSQTTPTEVPNPLSALMAALCDHTRTPSQALDPAAEAQTREKAIARFSDPHYELSLVPTEAVPAPTGDVASVPVRVHFKTENSELEATATAQFIKRGNSWYFANFDFLATPAFLIVVIIVCCSVGVGYATIVLVLRSRLAKRGQLTAGNLVRLFVPLCWRSLFRQKSQ